MNAHASSEVLGVHLVSGDETLRVGDLVRDQEGMTRLHVDEAYVAMPERPILSASIIRPGDEEATRRRLQDSTHLRGGRGIPAWFENLLPEGALRGHIESSCGRLTDFDLLRQLGHDLPGAVVVTDESAKPHPPYSANDLRFSLAGVQIKTSMVRMSDGFEMLEGGIDGDTVVKLPSPKLPFLPEVEFSTMRLAAAAGVDTAFVELVPLARLAGIPEEFVEEQGHALAIDRFDRTPTGDRIHCEDFTQILGVVSDRKYAAAPDEVVLKLAGMFGSGEECFLQACRRMAVNILAGNTDAHLKNWSVWYPDRVSGRLSPAYDIVAGAVYDHSDEMALRFRRTRNAAIMDSSRFERAAAFAGFSPEVARAEIGMVVEKAADTWGSMLHDLPMPEQYASYLMQRVHRMALAQEFGRSFEHLRSCTV